MTDPFFILGFPRSGTSALRLHITCNPGLVVPPECSFLTWLAPTYADWTVPDVDSDRLGSFLDDLATARKFTTWRLPVDDVRAAVEQDRPASYAALAGCVYRAFAAAQGKPRARWGDKNNVHLGMVDELVALFPTAQFVLILRDVRDVLASVRDVNDLSADLEYRPNLPSDAVDLGRMWGEQNGRALARLEAVAPGAHLVIRYEDFVADPRTVLTRVTQLLGAPWSEAMLSAHEANERERLEPEETMAWKALTRRPLTDERVGRWRERITETDAAAAVAAAEPAFSALGYRP